MTQQAVELGAFNITEQELRSMRRQTRRENIGRSWYKFSRNPLSVVGAATILIIILHGDLCSLYCALPRSCDQTVHRFCQCQPAAELRNIGLAPTRSAVISFPARSMGFAFH